MVYPGDKVRFVDNSLTFNGAKDGRFKSYLSRPGDPFLKLDLFQVQQILHSTSSRYNLSTSHIHLFLQLQMVLNKIIRLQLM